MIKVVGKLKKKDFEFEAVKWLCNFTKKRYSKQVHKEYAKKYKSLIAESWKAHNKQK